ncbi:unnamed protein product [Amoebophrya sp. A120]|nr:unnamed protein product [Amoebophrya sp. A120]|eukprot:GSA120T00005458001.1
MLLMPMEDVWCLMVMMWPCCLCTSLGLFYYYCDRSAPRGCGLLSRWGPVFHRLPPPDLTWCRNPRCNVRGPYSRRCCAFSSPGFRVRQAGILAGTAAQHAIAWIFHQQ